MLETCEENQKLFAISGGSRTLEQFSFYQTKRIGFWQSSSRGSGVDVNVGKGGAIRFQADYLPIFVGGGTVHNIRVTTGVVFKLGGN